MCQLIVPQIVRTGAIAVPAERKQEPANPIPKDVPAGRLAKREAALFRTASIVIPSGVPARKAIFRNVPILLPTSRAPKKFRLISSNPALTAPVAPRTQHRQPPAHTIVPTGPPANRRAINTKRVLCLQDVPADPKRKSNPALTPDLRHQAVRAELQ